MAQELANVLDRLSRFEPTPFPFISLYLDTRPNQHGRDQYQPFVRKEFKQRARAFPLRSSERESFERDRERVERYLRDDVRPSSNGLAIFACAAADGMFEAVQLNAPIEESRLYILHQPHLYPLARLLDQYRPYAALIADRHTARLYVFGLADRLEKDIIENPMKMNRHQMGGWSQARYQRHVDHSDQQHAKDVVDALDRVVREEQVDRILLAGDEVIIPLLRDQLPPPLAEKVVDVLRLDIRTPEHEVLRATLEALREFDAKDDREKVQRLLDEYRSGGLGVVGGHDTLAALLNGQVDELLISASLDRIHDQEEEVPEPLGPEAPATSDESGTRQVVLADELVTRARQTDAKVTFIEDDSLLAGVGGVGALLRFRVAVPPREPLPRETVRSGTHT
jgi:peptide chain release factor subunit 1